MAKTPQTLSERIIHKLGGPKKTAQLLECTVQAVYNWQGQAEDGTDNEIPAPRLRLLKALKPKVFKEIAAEDANAHVPL